MWTCEFAMWIRSRTCEWTVLWPTSQPMYNLCEPVKNLWMWCTSRTYVQPMRICEEPVHVTQITNLWTACVNLCANYEPTNLWETCVLPVRNLVVWLKSQVCDQPVKVLCVRMLWTTCESAMWLCSHSCESTIQTLWTTCKQNLCSSCEDSAFPLGFTILLLDNHQNKAHSSLDIHPPTKLHTSHQTTLEPSHGRQTQNTPPTSTNTQHTRRHRHAR